MSAHLLSNTQIEDASPLALEAIFGPDGGHPDAPPFVALLLDLDDETERTWRMSHTLEDGVWLPAWGQGSWAFDLRVWSVAERLMRVSMTSLTAIGDNDILTWHTYERDLRRYIDRLGSGPYAQVALTGELINVWNAEGRSLYPRHGDIAPWSCRSSFVVSLTLAVARRHGLRARCRMRSRGAPGGLHGHRWAVRARPGVMPAPAPSGHCPVCGAALAYLPREERGFLVPGSSVLRCPKGCAHGQQ